MDNRPAGASGPLDIRKYSNRRYYDATHSRHVTLEEIHALICAGHEIKVTDAKTGADLTAKVLAQIILERDPPKLDVFPVPLLHRLIRANEQLVKDFVDKYFNQALNSFLQSQRQFEGQLRRMMGLPSDESAPLVMDWARAMFGPFSPPFWRGEAPAGAAQPAERTGGEADPELRSLVESLQKQVQRLEEQLQAREPRKRRSDG